MESEEYMNRKSRKQRLQRLEYIHRCYHRRRRCHCHVEKDRVIDLTYQLLSSPTIASRIPIRCLECHQLLVQHYADR
jgi:hypothetical protein